jgi:FixJ family two-component response regulator
LLGETGGRSVAGERSEGRRAKPGGATTARPGEGNPVKTGIEAPAARGAETVSRPTVYVIDGDAGVRESLEVLLRTLGLDTRLFSAAEDFLAVYDGASGACLITEADLSGMSGLDLQEWLRTSSPSLPVIILAGRSEVRFAVRAIRSGAVDYLEKPVADRVLLSRVRQALNLEVHDSAWAKD